MTDKGEGVVVSGGMEEGEHYDEVVELTYVQGKGRQYALAGE